MVSLNLSLPSLERGVTLDGERALAETMLPDLFLAPAVDEQGGPSIGARLHFDDEVEGYSLSVVEGAELTIEVKTQ